MDRKRFDQIVESYGADAKRWPEAERAAALAFAEREGVDLSEARAIDALLALAPTPAAPSDLLQARILRARPKPVRFTRVAMALAACMLAGVLVGYGAGLNAPTSAVSAAASHEDVDAMIAMAFAPDAFDGELE